MTTRQSSTASRFLTDQGLGLHTPHLSEPVRDELHVQVARTDPESDGRWVGRLRRIGTAKLRHWGLEALVDDAQLLISELITNALRYGGNADICLSVVLTASRLVIAVNDGSPQRPQLTESNSDSETGRGIFLVAVYATDWGVSPDGTTTWCTLTVPVKKVPVC